MPMDRSRYPADWPAISLRIRQRDGNRCVHCGAVNGTYMLVERDGTRRETSPDDSDADEPLAPGQRITKIVLTVAHLGTPHADGTPGDVHDKLDVRPENLASLCQRCHFRYDRAEHGANAARTRVRRRIDRGQMALIADSPAPRPAGGRKQ